MDKFSCEGCGVSFSKGNIGSHRTRCPAYRDWSRGLPFRCPCGIGFSSERSLRSHKRGCSQSVRLEPGGRLCSCGERVTDVPGHRPLCKGPPDAANIVLTLSHPPDEGTCVCGKRHGTSSHRDYCPQWWVYRQSFSVKCEGCGIGFETIESRRVHSQFCEPWRALQEKRDREERTYPCPSCGELMRGPQLGLHVTVCDGSFTKADWEEWRDRRSRERRETEFGHLPDTEEGQSFVTCKLCGQRFLQLAEHLVTAHGTKAATYREITGGKTVATEMDDRRKGTLMERYQADHPSKISDHWKKTVATFLRRYKVKHPLQLESFLMKRRGTCRDLYGVSHPLQCEEVQAKIRASNRESFGADYYFASESFKEWSMSKYGTDHPMGNRDYVLKLFEKLSPNRPGPNGLEQRVWDMAPSLIFTGNWSWWMYLPKLKSLKRPGKIGRYKNPDFIVPGPDPEHPMRGVTRVVEAFGDYHHGEKVTGSSPATNEQELIDAYADIGISCLVLWESEVKSSPDAVRSRLTAHLSGA